MKIGCLKGESQINQLSSIECSGHDEEDNHKN